MQSAYVVAGAMTRFTRHPHRRVEELGAEAVALAFANTEVRRSDIDAVICASVYGGSLIGQRIARAVGLSGLPTYNVENACASGGTAVNLAMQMIRAGIHDRIVVVGVEKLSGMGSGVIPQNADEADVRQGWNTPAAYGLKSGRYFHETGCTSRDLARVVVKNRWFGSKNPVAHFQTETSVDSVEQSRMIATPLTLQHCCPKTDGAAAVVVSRESADSDAPPVEIIGSVVSSGAHSAAPTDTLAMTTVKRVAEELYSQIGIGPGDVDVAEVHDAFSIGEVLYYEALGWAARGEGYRVIQDAGERIPGGPVVNPSGGLLSRGHPLGATGIAQIVELFEQLTGRSGERQVAGATLGLAQVTGGGIPYVDPGAVALTALRAHGS